MSIQRHCCRLLGAGLGEGAVGGQSQGPEHTAPRVTASTEGTNLQRCALPGPHDLHGEERSGDGVCSTGPRVLPGAPGVTSHRDRGRSENRSLYRVLCASVRARLQASEGLGLREVSTPPREPFPVGACSRSRRAGRARGRG